MPSFSVEFERSWARRAKELGRDPTPAEAKALEAAQFQAWIDAGRLDELIRTILANHGREGGLEDVQALGYHLRQIRDRERIDALFRKLIAVRVKAFHDRWPRACDGHIGAMQAAAKAMAEAMDAYVEYFASLDALGAAADGEALREEMKRFQAREPLSAVLPKASKPVR